mmetsp:Transcript_85722/g.171607  ORF Transcript_85722/g.171607 Transcript_85722/m.171607 type:complete len:144 (-) Transcript_85722:315-746(-)
MGKTNSGRFAAMFVTALVACVVSSPGNELRGFCLQPPERRQDLATFFQPGKFVRSTAVGAMNLGLSLAVGSTAVRPVEALLAQAKTGVRKNPGYGFAFVLWVVHQLLAWRRAKKAELELKRIADAVESRGEGGGGSEIQGSHV